MSDVQKTTMPITRENLEALLTEAEMNGMNGEGQAFLRALLGERDRLRRGWLRIIQLENSCPATGGGCLAKRCGCLAEQEMLMQEASNGR